MATMDIEIRKKVSTGILEMSVHLPFPNSGTAKKSLYYSGGKKWNDSPGNIKKIKNVDGFKKQLKRNVHI